LREVRPGISAAAVVRGTAIVRTSKAQRIRFIKPRPPRS